MLLGIAVSAAAGVGLAVIDFREAAAGEEAAAAAASAARESGDGGTVWFCGAWGFPSFASVRLIFASRRSCPTGPSNSPSPRIALSSVQP